MTGPATPRHLKCALKSCDNRKAGIGDLCCPGHWKPVPITLKRALWLGEKQRSYAKKERMTMMAADDILTWLEDNVLIQPADQLGKKILATPDVEQPEAKRIITSDDRLVDHDKRLIIPGR